MPKWCDVVKNMNSNPDFNFEPSSILDPPIREESVCTVRSWSQWLPAPRLGFACHAPNLRRGCMPTRRPKYPGKVFSLVNGLIRSVPGSPVHRTGLRVPARTAAVHGPGRAMQWILLAGSAGLPVLGCLRSPKRVICRSMGQAIAFTSTRRARLPTLPEPLRAAPLSTGRLQGRCWRRQSSTKTQLE